MPKRKRGRSLFRTILTPQFIVLIAIILALTLSVPLSGMGDKIIRNYQNVVALQTANQVDYLESYMANNWAQLATLSGSITQTLQQKLDNHEFTIDQLDNDSSCYEPLLLSVSDELISTVASNHISGAFIILNTEDLDSITQRTEKPCLYLRDLDPQAIDPFANDLLVLRSPARILNALRLSKNDSYRSSFIFSNPTAQGFFYETFQRAYLAPEGQEPEGYWSQRPYHLEGDDATAMAYCIPIVLADGTVAGVVGIELLLDQIYHFLPAGQLIESEKSAFMVACSYNPEPSELLLIANGGEQFMHIGAGEILGIKTLSIGGYHISIGGNEFYAEVLPMNPHASDDTENTLHWFLIGAVDMDDMYAFNNELTHLLFLMLFLALAIGLVSVITVSRRLARPISMLVAEVENARSTESSNSTFTDTGIEEIDRLSLSFRELMQETVDTSTKFLRIMDMASVELAGYEWRDGSDSFYVTDNFLPMLGVDDVDAKSLSRQEFANLLAKIRSSFGASITLDGSRIYCISRNGNVRYVRAESSQIGDQHIGLLEDVTRSTQARIRIEHERDYDVLTGLYNRRAFYHRVGQLFTEPETLHHAALLLIDTDNLKETNDRFGHDWGDKYLRQIAQCIQENVPHNTICARISGDEIYLFFFGYHDNDTLLADIEDVMQAIRSTTIQFPDGESHALSVSGGIALYPDDSKSLAKLVKYADFAMYQAKESNKGSVAAFDAEAYAKNEQFNRGRGELREMIEQENVAYHFQPIFSAKTAQPAAYEALMRVNMPSIKSPDVVLRLAAAENSQYHIERITMFKAAESFRELLGNDQVSHDAMLFINSMPDQCLTTEDAEAFHNRFSELQSRIVLEITEDEYLGLDALEVKRNYPGFSGHFALDDYGSGYNGEKNLLLLQPQFVKVDVVFIRGIDTNPDRQQLVSSLVTYAHGRNMQVVAEGIETAEELQKVLELGVDLFQGYFLARPAAVPSAISPQAEEIIKNFHKL